MKQILLFYNNIVIARISASVEKKEKMAERIMVADGWVFRVLSFEFSRSSEA